MKSVIKEETSVWVHLRFLSAARNGRLFPVTRAITNPVDRYTETFNLPKIPLHKHLPETRLFWALMKNPQQLRRLSQVLIEKENNHSHFRALPATDKT